MSTWPFIKFIGTAANEDETRHLVQEGDQDAQTLMGWLKIKITDLGDQIADGDYFIPIYMFSPPTELGPQPGAGVDDADNRVKVEHTIVASGVDDADER